MNAALLVMGLALLAADPAPKSTSDHLASDTIPPASALKSDSSEGVAGTSRFAPGGASPATPLDEDDNTDDGASEKPRFGRDRFTPAARTAKPDPAEKDATGRFRRIGGSLHHDYIDETASEADPTNTEQPLVPIKKSIASTEKPADVKLPKKKLATLVMAQALEAPDKNGLAGRPLALQQAFSLAMGPLERIDVTGAYWKLSAATADHHLAIRHHDRLGQLQKLVEQHGRSNDAALIAATMTASKARVHKTHFEAVTAQHQLATMLRQPTADSLPLAEDLPLSGAYRTSFASIFATRPAPARARLIDRTLPIRLREIKARADAVLAADEAYGSQQDVYRLGQIYLPAVLASDESLRGQWVQFNAAVYAYNHDILQYAGIVGGATASDASLVGMLIEVKTKTAPRWVPREQPTLADPVNPLLRRK